VTTTTLKSFPQFKCIFSLKSGNSPLRDGSGNPTLDFSRPEKFTDNSFVEFFNESLHKEYLKTNWVMSLKDTREKIETWRQ